MLGVGPVRVQFLVQECIGLGGFVYDAYTGWNSVSRITVEEVIPRKDGREGGREDKVWFIICSI